MIKGDLFIPDIEEHSALSGEICMYGGTDKVSYGDKVLADGYCWLFDFGHFMWFQTKDPETLTGVPIIGNIRNTILSDPFKEKIGIMEAL